MNSIRNSKRAVTPPVYDFPFLAPDELFKAVRSSPRGLSMAEAKERLAMDGPNELEKAKRPTIAFLFFLQIINVLNLLLIIGAFASLIVNATGPDNGDWLSYIECIAIFLIVGINAGIGAVTENSAAGALEALSKLAQPKTTVIRDEKEIHVPSTDLVRGDIVVLAVGDIVPADCRLYVSDDLRVNEMLLTGESEDVHKNANTKVKHIPGPQEEPKEEKLSAENMAFSSCMVTNGKARGVVTNIGMNTKVGRIAMLLKGDVHTKEKGCLPEIVGEQTPLQVALQVLGVRIGFFAIFACAICFAVGTGLGVGYLEQRDSEQVTETVIYMVLVGVTLAVAAIPEGIPLCVTISLSTGCSDMVKEHVLVRRIAAVETLGCASVICTDKTGTLTEGKMTMVKMWSAGVLFDVSGKGFDPTTGKIMYRDGPKKGDDAREESTVVATLTSGLLCSDTRITQETAEDGTKKWAPHGNSTEAPIVVAAAKVGSWKDTAEKEMPRVFEVPFSSSRKMMLTVCSTSSDNKTGDVWARKCFPMFFKSATPKFFANVKGAPNFILEKCDSWTRPDGTIASLSAADRANIMKIVDDYSNEALRVIAIAVRAVDVLPFDPANKEDQSMTTDQKFGSLIDQPNLVLCGLIANIDPERDGVPQAVLDAQGGHIRVVMITGDYLLTAKAIARNVNILTTADPDYAALDCGALRIKGEYIPDDEIDNITKTVKVYARAQPEDKLQIVKSLQRQGLVCAMTGDGVNDAPALKRADIGVAMGLQGTEVAKGASDMVLTDDNFCSIVKAVEKGRLIYAGIQKFVAFILSVHLAEVLQIFICIIANMPIMRTPLQILFLILVTDLPPSIALGMEKSARNILKERPRPKGEQIVLMWQWQGILANGLILAATTLVVYTWALHFFLDGTYQTSHILDKFCDDICSDGKSERTVAMLDNIKPLVFARTTAFISLVYSDNIRAYASRSFSDPVWVDLCTNKTMQKAIGFAQVGLYIAVFVPGISDTILQLEGARIGWEGWIAAILGAFATLVLCEIYKYLSKGQITAQRNRLAAKFEADALAREKLMDEKKEALAKENAAKLAVNKTSVSAH